MDREDMEGTFYVEPWDDHPISEEEVWTALENLANHSDAAAEAIQNIIDSGQVVLISMVEGADTITRPFNSEPLGDHYIINIDPYEMANSQWQDTDGTWRFDEYIEIPLAHELFHVEDKILSFPEDPGKGSYDNHEGNQPIGRTNQVREDLGIDERRGDYGNIRDIDPPNNNYDPVNWQAPPESPKPDTPLREYFNNFLAAGSSGLNPDSPLILDMDGDGIDLVSLENSSTYFDIEARDFANKTGWTIANDDDAFLAVDSNSNGVIDDINELFGNGTTDGFTELAAYDSNSDDLINSSDTNFSDLLIWTDLDADGITDAGELQTLTQAGITEIDISATSVDYDIEGHNVSHESTFTVNGNTRDIVDVWFENNPMDTVYLGDHWDSFDPEYYELPSLSGHGTLKDVAQAIYDDSGLKTTFEELVFNHGSLGEELVPKVGDVLVQAAAV